MNVMNSNNIDNNLQPKRDFSTKKSAIKMGQERINVLTLKTADRDGEKGSIEKSHVDVVGKTKDVSSKDVSSTGADEKKVKRKRKSPLVPWKKPEGMPKRPLSAYNLFFQDRRKSIMLLASESSESSLDDSKQSRKSSKKKSGVGFANLARTIGAEWRALPLDQKAPYESLAAGDKDRYDREMKVWRAKEKERKAMRESGSKVNAQSFEWSTLASITGARKGFGEDLQSMRNIASDPSLPLSDMISGMGARGQSSSMMQLQDHESRGAFHSSIYSNYNNNPFSMDASPDQPSNMMMQQQQRQQLLEDLDAYSSSPSFNMAERRQLASFNSIVKDSLEQNSGVRENFPYDMGSMSASSSPQATQPNQYQNNPFLASRGMKKASKTMAWSNQRSAPNMDNAMSTSIDLEPLPLPDSHQPQQQGKLPQKTREGQMGWTGLLGLQQMHARDQQQQRTTIASDEQFLRRLSTGGTPMFTAGWGQNNLWNTDTNEPIAVPFGGRNVNPDTAGRNVMMPSQDMEEAKSGNNDTRSFPSSSNNPNEDLYRYYNDGPN